MANRSQFALCVGNAQALIDGGKQRRALAELWRAEALARGDVAALTDLLELASSLNGQVEHRRSSELEDLVEVLYRDIENAERRPAAYPPAPSVDSTYVRRHRQKFSSAWWFKVLGLAPFGLVTLSLLYTTVALGVRFVGSPSHHNLSAWPGVLVTGVVVAAFGLLGWRRPGILGVLVLLIALPIGTLLGWVAWALGDGTSSGDLVLLELLFAGVPLVSAVLLIMAARARKQSPAFGQAAGSLG
jgi:hypothetical protein